MRGFRSVDARGQIAVGAYAVSSDWIARVDGVVGVEIRLELYPLGDLEELRDPEIEPANANFEHRLRRDEREEGCQGATGEVRPALHLRLSPEWGHDAAHALPVDGGRGLATLPDEVTADVSRQIGVRVSVGVVVDNLPLQTFVQSAAVIEPARDVMARALEAVDRPTTWDLPMHRASAPT
jgi:hypothetical protein